MKAPSRMEACFFPCTATVLRRPPSRNRLSAIPEQRKSPQQAKRVPALANQNATSHSSLLLQILHFSHIAPFVALFIHGCLSDERAMRKSRIIQQSPKRLQANRSLADVLVPVQLRAAGP